MGREAKRLSAIKRTTSQRRAFYKSRLPRSFYARGHTSVAIDLLGKILWCDSDDGFVAVRIVETEAYGGADDPGSHGFKGMTPRNGTMFGPPGHAYVYFTYGMHFCLNVVTGREGECSAVLLRAAEPLEGIDIIMRRRRTDDFFNLASGPGKLAQALGIDRTSDGADLCSSTLGISDDGFTPEAIYRSYRVGLRRDGGHQWRYCIDKNRFVSRPWPWQQTQQSRVDCSRAQ